MLSLSSGLKWRFWEEEGLYRVVLPSITTSAVKMETVCFSEVLASLDVSIQRQNPEE
jgi:hypothetical protein